MKLTVSTPPTAQPITYAQAKTHLRLLDDDDKAYIQSTIEDAVAYAETYLGSSLANKTYQATFYNSDLELSSNLFLPNGPVTGVTGVTSDGESVSTDEYSLEVVGNDDVVIIQAALSAPVVVTYTAGYATFPADLRRALLMHVAHLYENREVSAGKAGYEIPFGVKATYDLHRRPSVIG